MGKGAEEFGRGGRVWEGRIVCGRIVRVGRW